MKKKLLIPLTLMFSISWTALFGGSINAQDQDAKIEQEVTHVLSEKEALLKYRVVDNEYKREAATVVYPNAIDQLDVNYLDVIVNEITKYEKQHPHASEDQINEYFMELCKIYNSKNQNKSFNAATALSNGFYNIIGGKAQLNAQEQALFDSNPSKGAKAIVAGKEAWDYTEYKFGFNGHNDKSDAFRHAAWNIWIMGFTDWSWAYDWTTAHEEGSSYNPALEKEMDLNNNSIGRLYGSINNISPNSTPAQTRAAIISAYKSGDLKYFYWSSFTGTVLVKFTGYDSDFIN
ncbi:DUF6973 domain-containing protein [Paenibacillus sp. GCM10012307]|uniref:DUF6973 domain-containing protein n=1 Tax=Paenibacillus roseus TaxID=2798579 RepID=A0A934J8U2_9BACL|nr:hypothetical protein [Paenibacillus roseus]MBJ6362480.1 hypothetical protein [Paenibacillus roseus]